MNIRPRILLVEDDRVLAAALDLALTMDGFKVIAVGTGEEALDALSSAEYSVLVLDIGLPGIDGFEVLARLRGKGQALPVIVLTANDDPASRTKAFSLGTDEYLSKPIGMREFRQRVRAILRHGGTPDQPRLAYGPLTMDVAANRAFLNGASLELTSHEWALLLLLLNQAGKTLSRSAIRRALGDKDEGPSPTAIEAWVSRLRTKLGSSGVQIQLVRGLGYILHKQDEDAKLAISDLPRKN